ncbi:Os06g0360500 [Oryza sativa Japonica Group]|uniref:Os06g0360500 protein n=2 Tax=Oryza sativa subsp. japonica TaxID=39947 RepID=Q0DCA5_ORYSJ|nr:hypothetical protein EE612_034024 [Oryza sativa]BAF19518.1 Os06g0360500 [Oryza sativa Japonica Group]BAS97702.1 Os06g0360500 [Oryza sativa Japonica Group]|eukprot:NP_001057604.1 Os06g0360500 [Oryza sativa Japonica Group]
MTSALTFNSDHTHAFRAIITNKSRTTAQAARNGTLVLVCLCATHELEVWVLGQASAGAAHVCRAGDHAEAPLQKLLHDPLAGAARRAGHEDGGRLLGVRRTSGRGVYGGDRRGGEAKLSGGGAGAGAEASERSERKAGAGGGDGVESGGH